MDLARLGRAWGVAGAASERPQRGERRIGEPIAARGEASPPCVASVRLAIKWVANLTLDGNRAMMAHSMPLIFPV